jgi:hypothetical protein
MIPLTTEQKELLFDYSIGLTSQEQATEAQALIASNKQAQEIHSKLKDMFALLDTQDQERCPDFLAEQTILRLTEEASASRDRLRQLLATEQAKPAGGGRRILLGLGGKLAMAAMFVVAGSIFMTAFNYLRYNSRVQQCGLQMDSISRGLTQYVSDYDGQPPALAAAPGDPWWKVGAQGEENHSNTRNMYLLVKGQYVKLSDFVCPGSKSGEVPQLTSSQIQAYKDFPSRSCVTYSFQVSCHRTKNGKLLCRKVLMADWNPLFDDHNGPLQVRVTPKLLTLNSINHNRRGQNVLFGDSRVEYKKTRLIGTDDIFTLQDTDVYQGCEVPSCETDFFLAP